MLFISFKLTSSKIFSSNILCLWHLCMPTKYKLTKVIYFHWRYHTLFQSNYKLHSGGYLEIVISYQNSKDIQGKFLKWFHSNLNLYWTNDSFDFRSIQSSFNDNTIHFLFITYYFPYALCNSVTYNIESLSIKY